MVWLRVSAGLSLAVGVGFGLPLPFVASYLLTRGRLPMFLGLFPAYGGGLFDGWRPSAFVAALLGFAPRTPWWPSSQFWFGEGTASAR